MVKLWVNGVGFMNNKGFTLVELLGCLVLLGFVLGIGLYSARGTLSTTLTTLDQVSENEIYDSAEIYLMENGVDGLIMEKNILV